MTPITPRNLGIAAAATLGVVGAGVLARTLSHHHDGAGDATDTALAPSPAKQGVDHLPTYSWKGKDLAVAWWPENMRLDHSTAGATLHFEGIVGNLGVSDVPIAPGDHLQYDVYHRNGDGTLGAQVGSGSAPLDRLDVQSFPPPFGESTGKPSSDFGRDLQAVDHLAPQTVGVIGADQASQSVDIGNPTPGEYVLRETIVRANRDGDPEAYNDVRDTAFQVHADGDLFQTSSSYAG